MLHLSLHSRMDVQFMPLPHAYALYFRKPRAPASPPRTRSPTLPLDEDTDGETDRETDNKNFISTHDTADHIHETSAASKAKTRELLKRKLKDHPVLKPAPSRISKQSPNERGLRRRILKPQHQAKSLNEKTENSQNTRQPDSQNSNFTSPTTLPTDHADQADNLNNQPNSLGQQIQPHRASVAPHLESAQRAITRRTRVPKRKFSTEVNANPPTISNTVHKTRRRNRAQKARHPKEENTQRSPREHKTHSGRVSKRPERLGFT